MVKINSDEYFRGYLYLNLGIPVHLITLSFHHLLSKALKDDWVSMKPEDTPREDRRLKTLKISYNEDRRIQYCSILRSEDLHRGHNMEDPNSVSVNI